MNVFELFGTIAIDHSEAERGLDKTVRHARETENALERTFKRIGRYVATAFTVSSIVNFGKTCTQVYADVAAEESAFEQIMGDYAETARDKLEAVADRTGITSTRMTSAFNALTAKFKGLGYSTEDATTLAADGLLIAADAAAFWNMSLDEAMAHLNSFINGSYEGGEAIGLFATDTQMAAYAVEKGIIADAAAWAQLDEATKQALRLDYARAMMANSGVTGQAAAEAGAFANVLGNLQEAWRQLQAVIGKPILEKIVLPAMKKLNEFMPVLTENVQKGIDWLTDGFDKIAEYFSEVFTEDGLNLKALPSALRDMFRDVSRAIPSLLSTVGRTIRNAWVNTVWPAIQGAFKMAFGVELPKWSDIEKSVIAWWDGGNGIAAEIAKVCNWTLNMFGAPATVTEEDVNTILSSWWEGAKGLVSSFCDWTLKLFTNPVEAAADVEKTVKGWWTGVKSGAEAALVWVLKLFGVPEAKAEGVKNLVSSWWQGVKTAAQEALNWTLKLFTNPKETVGEIATRISTWWAGVRSSAQSVLNWVLKLFGVPTASPDAVKNLVSGWWSGVKTAAQNALIWVLKLFNNPKEAAADVKNAVSDWWSGVKSGAESALDWVLKLFGVPEAKADGVKNLVSGWWQGVKTAAQEALVWTLKLFENPKETAGQIAANISTWWAGVVASAQSALDWVLKLFENPKETASKVGEVVGDWWNGVKSGAEAALDWVLKLFGVPLAKGDGVKNLVSGWWSGVKQKAQDALIWTLKLFDLPYADNVVDTITLWWEKIRPSIESALGIDLSSIDIAGLFTAASTAIDNVIEDAKTFCSDVAKAISWDMSGRINLGMTLSNLFNAGVTAIGNLLGSASTLVGDIVAAVTGDKEAGQKIGGVFSNLFGWAAEIIIGVKEGAIGAFQWLLDHKDVVAGALTSIAGAMFGMALVSNPFAAVIASLITLIGVMTTDWETFEEKYPQLVDMFEDLTGLDFTDVANSLESFKTTVGGVLEYLATHESELSFLLAILGGVAMYTGHPIAGIALLSAGNYLSRTERDEEIGRVMEESRERSGRLNTIEGDNYNEDLIESLKHGTGSRSESFLTTLYKKVLADGLFIPKGSETHATESGTTANSGGRRFGGEVVVPTDLMRNEFSRIIDLIKLQIPNRDGEPGGRTYPLGAPADADTITYDPENLNLAGNMGMMSLVTMMQTVATQIKADVIAGAQEGVAAGLSGVTITANVSTGDIKLDDGTLVGAITPRINFILGALNARSGRG